MAVAARPPAPQTAPSYKNFFSHSYLNPSLKTGLNLVLAYLRVKGLRTLCARAVAREFYVPREDYGTLTAIGQGLGHLARRGFLKRVTAGVPRKYAPTVAMLWWLSTYPCLQEERCQRCPLRGTLACPFLRPPKKLNGGATR